MKRAATVILNRNLPTPTDNLYEHLFIHDGNLTDIFVLEAGSQLENLSKYCTWHASDSQSMKEGLRYCRGTNYALYKLYKEGRWDQYEAFFILTNDTVLTQDKTIEPLLKILNEHPKVGILSPCSVRWGEEALLRDSQTMYFWFIHNNALFLRRAFLESIIQSLDEGYMNFIFDGTNFRGYLSENELISKAYANDWAAAVTSKVFAEENETYLLEKADLIRTEPYGENMRLYLKEGKTWLKQKYGFNSHWSMIEYTKNFYDLFFKLNPELNKFRI